MKSRAEIELEEFEVVFSALANPTRRRILVVLLHRKGEMTAGDIVERFDCQWPTMTRHLIQLQEAGLVSVSKVGRERRYILNKDKLTSVVDAWVEWFR